MIGIEPDFFAKILIPWLPKTDQNLRQFRSTFGDLFLFCPLGLPNPNASLLGDPKYEKTPMLAI